MEHFPTLNKHITNPVVAAICAILIFGAFTLSVHAGVGARFSFDTQETISHGILAIGNIEHAAATAAASGDLSDRVVILVASTSVSHEFKKSEAVDKGDFKSPAGFTQKNLCDTNPSLPHFSVCFRPDADGSRDEVVFEYGTFMQKPVPLGSYTATFYKGSTKLGEQKIEHHSFYQRWRWLPDGYRPRYRTISELESKWLLPPYRKEFGNGAKTRTPDPRLVYERPLVDNAGITQGMGTTGERDDIGPITEWQANYLLTQNDDWWKIILAQAEAGMAAPWNIRDEKGTPINMYRTKEEGAVVDRLTLTSHSNVAGAPFYIERPNDTGWGIDVAHQPALFYVPWLLTGDPYYLEGMQFANTHNTIWTSWARTSKNLAQISEDQLRGVAWAFRNLVGLRLSTPTDVPGWLLPRSYYERMSKENAVRFTDIYVNGTNNAQKIFHYYHTDMTYYGVWQQDFLSFGLGWAAAAGLTEWKPVFAFAIKNQIDRSSGKSGWPREFPTPYHVYATDDVDKTSWKALWDTFVRKNVPGAQKSVDYARSLVSTEYPAGGVSGQNMNYAYLLGTLAIATHADIPEAASLYRWLSEAVQHPKNEAGIYFDGYLKWAVAPKYAFDGTLPKLPDVVDTTPTFPTTPTPTTTPTIPDTPDTGKDTTAPTAPSNLTLSLSSHPYVMLSWNKSTDAVGVTGYRIYRNGENAPLGTITTTSYTDTKVVTGNSYSYTIEAFDAAGNTSIQSSASSITVGTLPQTPARTPINFSLSGDAFTQTNTCRGGTIERNGYCKVSVMFKPTAVMTYTGSLTVNIPGTDTQTTIPLIGSGIETSQNGGDDGEKITGTAGDDTIEVYEGTRVVNGRGGSDTAKILATYPRDWYRVIENADGSVTLAEEHATGYRVQLRNIEKVVFPDGSILTFTKEAIEEAGTITGDTVTGTDSNDVLSVVEGIHSVDGKGGTDIAQILLWHPSVWFTFTKNADGSVTMQDRHATGYTVTFRNVEEIQFADGTKKPLTFLGKVLAFFETLEEGLRSSSEAAALLSVAQSKLDFGQTQVNKERTITFKVYYKDTNTATSQ